MKLSLLSDKRGYMKFRVVEGLEEAVMQEFMQWIRYVEFDGDLTTLHLMKNEAIIAA